MTLPVAESAHNWMVDALIEARLSLDTGDVPVGALVVDAAGNVIGRGHNSREVAPFDPTAHAEITALRQAAQIVGDWQLSGHTLIVTLEPCVMCAGAIQAARIERVIFGAYDEKAGAAGSVYDVLRDRRLPHRVEVVGGVDEAACAELLQGFFADRRGV